MTLLSLLGSIVLLCAAMVIHPDHARCDATMWVNGVRPDGTYELRRVPVGDDEIGPRGELDHSRQPPGVLVGRVYCGGRLAIVVDSRTVGCQR